MNAPFMVKTDVQKGYEQVQPPVTRRMQVKNSLINRRLLSLFQKFTQLVQGLLNPVLRTIENLR